MEIRKVTKEIENDYPTIEKVNEKNLKKVIPKRWTKLGISMLFFYMLMGNKIFAFNTHSYNIPSESMVIAGGGPSINPIIVYTRLGILILSAIMGLNIIIDLIELAVNKKRKIDDSIINKIKKHLKRDLIIMGAIIIISIIANIAIRIF